MLAYVLALAVGLGSLTIFMAAFFFPEVHRKNDFIWSGVGLFYALVLWVCAGRITGGVLLGQVAGIALLGWSVTQTLQLRRELTPRQQQTELPSAEAVKNTIQDKVSKLSPSERLSQFSKQISSSVAGAKDQIQQKLSATQSKSKPERVPTPAPVTTSTSTASTSVAPTTVAPTTVSTSTVDETAVASQPTPPASTDVVETTEKPSPSSVEVEASEAIAAPDTTLELVRPDPPDPELVEAAIRDAKEKSVEFSPPEPAPHATDSSKPEE